MLAVASTATYHAFLLDPQDPKKFFMNRTDPNVANVLAVLNSLSANYREKYSDRRFWKIVDPFHVSYSLNLWRQPNGNCWDCGVIVCAYIWAFVTGYPLPLVTDEGNRTRRASFNKLMTSTKIALMNILFE